MRTRRLTIRGQVKSADVQVPAVQLSKAPDLPENHEVSLSGNRQINHTIQSAIASRVDPSVFASVAGMSDRQLRSMSTRTRKEIDTIAAFGKPTSNIEASRDTLDSLVGTAIQHMHEIIHKK